MANSTTNLDLISSSQASKEVTQNALNDAFSQAAIGGRRASTTTGLTWGYYGGNVNNSGTITAVVNGTLTLADNTTNYVEMTTAGVVSSNTSAFTGGRTQLYTVVTASGLVTSYTDKRAPGTGSGGGTIPTGTGFVHITSAAQDSAARAVDVSSADVTGILASARFPALTGDVTTSSGSVATTWTGGTASKAINGAPTVTIASASTVNIGAAIANYISITGTVTITAFDSIAAGAERAVAFTGALTLTHNSSSLILPSAANITTATGDSARFVSLGSGNWRCLSYTKADGTPVVAGSGDMLLGTIQTVTALKTFGAAGAVSKFALAGTTSGSTVLDASAVASGTATLPAGTYTVGYLNVPQNSQSTAYTTVLADQGKHIYHPSVDTTARTFTIDSNANVAYAVGTAITFVNDNGAGIVTIAITSDTLRFAGTGSTGSRTLAANGIATALKITTTSWMISGTGLT